MLTDSTRSWWVQFFATKRLLDHGDELTGLLKETQGHGNSIDIPGSRPCQSVVEVAGATVDIRIETYHRYARFSHFIYDHLKRRTLGDVLCMVRKDHNELTSPHHLLHRLSLYLYCHHWPFSCLAPLLAILSQRHAAHQLFRPSRHRTRSQSL